MTRTALRKVPLLTLPGARAAGPRRHRGARRRRGDLSLTALQGQHRGVGGGARTAGHRLRGREGQGTLPQRRRRRHLDRRRPGPVRCLLSGRAGRLPARRRPAAAGNALQGRPSRGLKKTTDGGATWFRPYDINLGEVDDPALVAGMWAGCWPWSAPRFDPPGQGCLGGGLPGARRERRRRPELVDPRRRPDLGRGRSAHVSRVFTEEWQGMPRIR